LLVELEKAMNPQVYGKRKCSKPGGAHVKIWSRMMCLWKLPYWHKLKLRHTLYVMHIDKNICEIVLATILNIIGKTKNTVKARLDLKDLGIRPELQFKEDGDSCEMPNARYTLSIEKKGLLCFSKRGKVSRRVFGHMIARSQQLTIPT
jgi:hypothetical protein